MSLLHVLRSHCKRADRTAGICSALYFAHENPACGAEARAITNGVTAGRAFEPAPNRDRAQECEAATALTRPRDGAAILVRLDLADPLRTR